MEQLLTLFNRFSRLVKEAFQDDPRFLTARDKVTSVSWGFPDNIRACRVSPVCQTADLVVSAGVQSCGQRRHHLQAGAAHEAERVSSAGVWG